MMFSMVQKHFTWAEHFEIKMNVTDDPLCTKHVIYTYEWILYYVDKYASNFNSLTR